MALSWEADATITFIYDTQKNKMWTKKSGDNVYLQTKNTLQILFNCLSLRRLGMIELEM